MQRTRFLVPGLVTLLVGTLALAACNSSSVSGSQPKASGASNAETKSTSTSTSGSGPQGLIGAAASKTK